MFLAGNSRSGEQPSETPIGGPNTGEHFPSTCRWTLMYGSSLQYTWSPTAASSFSPRSKLRPWAVSPFSGRPQALIRLAPLLRLPAPAAGNPGRSHSLSRHLLPVPPTGSIWAPPGPRPFRPHPSGQPIRPRPCRQRHFCIPSAPPCPFPTLQSRSQINPKGSLETAGA